MIVPVTLFATNFLYIALKAFQQKNVMHDKYMAMIPTSCAMAVCEYFITGTIATIAVVNSNTFVETAINVASIGLGGGLGSVLATYQHNRMRRAST